LGSKNLTVALPEASDDLEIISVRAVDVQILKENLKEVKDLYTKAVSDTEYRLYERETEVKRATEAETKKLRLEVDRLTIALSSLSTEATQKSADYEHRMEDIERKFRNKLDEVIIRFLLGKLNITFLLFSTRVSRGNF
jgi:3-deoxy-D-arabino-heptulosonate 7-phosphate (DAHP) synthase